MSQLRQPDPWPDERVDRAFRALVDVEPPPGLVDKVLHELRGESLRRLGSPSAIPRHARWAVSPLAGLAALALVVIVGSALWVGAPHPSAPGFSDGTFSVAPGGSVIPSLVAGGPWPVDVTLPGSAGPQPVVSVSDAAVIRDAESVAREIVVGGWYVFHPVPCGALPDPTSPLEDCAVDFTWLMAAPENLYELASDGSGSIHPPRGPGINPVLAYVDWSAPTDDQPLPVVFAGHFHDARATGCPAGDRRTRCEHRFVVDSVIWTSGSTNDLAGAPQSVFGLPVENVSDAVSVRARGSATEIAIKGWYWAPGPLRCLYRPAGVQFLEGGCELAFTWLMENPEVLASSTSSGQPINGPAGPAIQPVFAGPTPPTLSLTQPGASSPVPAVFVGHFNDRRSRFCTLADNPESDGPTACRARFVVDAVAWVSGVGRPIEINDWRDSTDPLPTPRLDPLENFIGSGTVLGELVVSGPRIGTIEPELTRKPTDLSTQPSLWLVTVLDQHPMPTMYKGVYIFGPTVRTLVFTVACAVYQDAGAGFEAIPIRCPASVLQPSGSR